MTIFDMVTVVCTHAKRLNGTEPDTLSTAHAGSADKPRPGWRMAEDIIVLEEPLVVLGHVVHRHAVLRRHPEQAARLGADGAKGERVD